MSDRPDLVRHYGGHGFVGRLDDVLTKAGLGGKRLSPNDLAPLDQFHARGPSCHCGARRGGRHSIPRTGHRHRLGTWRAFLLTAEDMLTALLQRGFRTSSWIDRSDAAIEWFDEQRMARAHGAPPTLGIHLAMGPDFPEMAANLERNLQEGRVGLVQAIMRRP